MDTRSTLAIHHFVLRSHSFSHHIYCHAESGLEHINLAARQPFFRTSAARLPNWFGRKLAGIGGRRLNLLPARFNGVKVQSARLHSEINEAFPIKKALVLFAFILALLGGLCARFKKWHFRTYVY